MSRIGGAGDAGFNRLISRVQQSPRLDQRPVVGPRSANFADNLSRPSNPKESDSLELSRAAATMPAAALAAVSIAQGLSSFHQFPAVSPKAMSLLDALLAGAGGDLSIGGSTVPSVGKNLRPTAVQPISGAGIGYHHQQQDQTSQRGQTTKPTRPFDLGNNLSEAQASNHSATRGGENSFQLLIRLYKSWGIPLEAATNGIIAHELTNSFGPIATSRLTSQVSEQVKSDPNMSHALHRCWRGVSQEPTNLARFLDHQVRIGLALKEEPPAIARAAVESLVEKLFGGANSSSEQRREVTEALLKHTTIEEHGIQPRTIAAEIEHLCQMYK